jgi:excisionase family DNA binding protein
MEATKVTKPEGSLLDLTEAAAFLNLSPSAVWRLQDEGKLKSVRVAGLKKILFRPCDLNEALQVHEA